MLALISCRKIIKIVLCCLKQEGQGECDIETLAQPHDMEEARYLLTKLIGMTLNHAALAAQREASNKELQSQVGLNLSTSLASIHIAATALKRFEKFN